MTLLSSAPPSGAVVAPGRSVPAAAGGAAAGGAVAGGATAARVADGGPVVSRAALAEARWGAVVRRDRAAAGWFVYAVRTTGVYCRPGCASRLPRRDNVEFFAGAAAAQEAGFRACRRCTPDRPAPPDPALGAVVALCRALEDPDESADVAGVAAAHGWSARHLRRRFAEVVGVPVGTYRRAAQAGRARAALRAGRPVTDAVWEAGYGSARAFYDHGAPRLGMPAGAYAAGAPGVAVTWGCVATAVGTVVAARTDRGLCSVRIGAAEGPLVDALAAEFPGAVLRRDDAALAGVTDALAAAATGAPGAEALPLDVAGTAFQARVWDALRSIPRGETRTYGEVAAMVGLPGAARAVGSACGANPVALAVPCHRVVRADGAPGGYRWGPGVKQRLLDAERV